MEEGDRFGNALAIGRFNDGAAADLAVGAPLEDVGNLLNAGLVTVLYGDTSGTAEDAFVQGVNMEQGEVPGGATEASDEFGNFLAAGPINSDDRDDLLIGA